MSTELSVIDQGGQQGISHHRQATDAASVCKSIVLRTAMTLQGRKYVRVEGWQAIANAFGCVASAVTVERVETGFRAVGQVRRMSDGAVIAEAEGFVGDDETKTWAKRPEYAKRAMAQTRAISRACRSAFAFVVTMMDANLETTPAEEMDYVDAGPAFPREAVAVRPRFTPPAPAKAADHDEPAAADPFEAAKEAIASERDIDRLTAMRAKVDRRLKEKVFAPFQADELLDMVQSRIEFLEAEKEVVA